MSERMNVSLEIWMRAKLTRTLRKTKRLAAYPVGNGKPLEAST